jgi:hypothetical protein
MGPPPGRNEAADFEVVIVVDADRGPGVRLRIGRRRMRTLVPCVEGILRSPEHRRDCKGAAAEIGLQQRVTAVGGDFFDHISDRNPNDLRPTAVAISFFNGYQSAHLGRFPHCMLYHELLRIVEAVHRECELYRYSAFIALRKNIVPVV